MLSRAVLVVALLGSASGVVQAQTKLLFNSFAPPSHVMNQRVFPVWIKQVEDATQGRVKIETSPSSLAPPPGQLDLVVKGGADLAWQFSGVVANRLAMNQMTQIPSPTASSVVMSRAMWRTHEKFFGPANEYKDLKLIALFVFPAAHIYTLKEPLNSPEQIKQMKIVTVPGADAKAWGSLTTGILTSPVVRYFEFVSKGTVDAYASMPISDLIPLNLARHTKFIVDLKDAKNSGTFAFVMNAAKWASIAKSDQAAIEKVSGEAFAALMKGMDDATDEVLKKATADGVKLVTAPDPVIAAVKQAHASTESDWLAEASKRGVDGKAALDFYRAQVRELAK